MKNILTVFLSVCFIAVRVAGEENPPSHTIVLTAKSDLFVFGRPVYWKVSYCNQGKDPWVIPTPTASTSVGLYYSLVGSTESCGYSLGKQASTIKPIPISIAPGKSCDFEIPLERCWTGNVVPGYWNVWIEDDKLNLKSNKVEMPLRFTVDSMVVCLEKAMDETLDITQRKCYAEWLIKIMPGLDLRWWFENTPDQERQKMEVEIKQKLQAFKIFLADKNNAKTIETAIKNINKERGIPDASGLGLVKSHERDK